MMAFAKTVCCLSTVGDLLNYAKIRFKKAHLFYGHGTTSAEEEALYLVFGVLNLSPSCPKRLLDKGLDAQTINHLVDLIEKRVTTCLPVAYLTHKAWQGNDVFYVDERVIIPRSFIYGILEEIISPWIPEPNRVSHALDLCTGSGALAIQMAHRFKNAKIDAVDISSDALEVAKINIENHRCQDRIHLILSDLFKEIHPVKQYDLIVTNPPYVNTKVMKNLPAEYRHEPVLALDGGKNGLDIIKPILKRAAHFLKTDGILLIEVGHNKASLEKTFPELPFIWLSTPNDTGNVCLLSKNDLTCL